MGKGEGTLLKKGFPPPFPNPIPLPPKTFILIESLLSDFPCAGGGVMCAFLLKKGKILLTVLDGYIE